MRISPSVDRVTFTVVGHFNPAIFSPSWFALNELVGKNEADQASVQVIHPEVCQISVGQFQIYADLNRFTASCDANYHLMARDLAIGTFGNFLVHTPITAMGINREVHFDTGDFWIRDEVGNRLAPKEAWGAWGQEISGLKEATNNHGGMMRIAMQQPRLNFRCPSYIQTEVQPSQHPDLQRSGIYMLVNNHYQLSSTATPAPIKDVMDTLESEWEPAIEKADFIIDQIQCLTESCKKELAEKR